MTRLVEDPVLGQRYRFERSGDVLTVEAWIEPGGGVTPHVHPSMEERFKVLDGEVEFLVGRRWRALPEVVVPAGTRHAYRNVSAGSAHMVTEVTPPLELEEFLIDVAALAREGKFTRRGLPAGPRAAVAAAAVAARYRSTVELDFPPWFAVAALARLGRSRTTGHSTAIR